MDDKMKKKFLLEGGPFRHMIEHFPRGILLLNNQRILFANDKMARIIGSGQSTLLNKPLVSFIHPSYIQYFTNWIDKIEPGNYNYPGAELILIKNDNSYIQVGMNANYVYQDNKNLIQLMINDTLEKNYNKSDVHTLTEKASLSKLLNHSVLEKKVSQAIEIAKRDKRHLAVMYINLDQYKLINEIYGYKTVELLSQAVMQRLKKESIASDIILTLGGAEFVVLVQRIELLSTVDHFIKKFLAVFSQPFRINSQDHFVTATMGISVYPENGLDSQTLLNNANLAHYYAKQQEKKSYQLVTPTMSYRMKEKQELLYCLRTALAKNELKLLYQPVINTMTGKIVGLEALLRWVRSNGEVIPPIDFLTLAEESGLIFQIGTWVIREACQQNRDWQQKGLPPLPISINLSTQQFNIQKHLILTIQSILADMQLSPACLEFEMSENVTVLDTGSDVLKSLKEMGIALTLHDFGANYFSLNELRRFQIDKIKIDQSLIMGIPNQLDAASIVTAIIAMGEKLGIEVVASGVETKEQLAFLSQHGCYLIQGNGVCPPLKNELIFPILNGSEPLPFVKKLIRDQAGA